MGPINKTNLLIKYLKEIARFLRYGTREKLFIFFAVMLFTLGKSFNYLELAKSDIFLKVWQLDIYQTDLYIALYVLAGLCVAYVILRFYYKFALVKPVESTELPTSIKGLMSFTNNAEDGKLFFKLKRDKELAQLKNLIFNAQIPLILLMGESGAGKTSLLRAGLSYLLKDSEIKYIYWEALPSDAITGLLKAVNNGLNSSFSELPELLNSTQKAVIVLDQFEQLLPPKPEFAAIFNFLNTVMLAQPPHHFTWIVAFQREYLPDWCDFELENKLQHPPMLSLKFLSILEGQEVIITLAEEAGLSLEQKLVQNFIQSVQNDGRLSPVIIGIGLSMFQELANSKQISHLELQHYSFAGGSQGLFVSFLKDKIEQCFPKKFEQEALFRMLVDLIDLSRNQRQAEGKTLEELMDKAVGLSEQYVEFGLKYLASAQVRLLEKVSRSNMVLAYRLSHESMIPALRQLGNKLLGEIEQTNLMLQTAFTSWQNSAAKNKRYLLSGKDLTTVLKFKEQLDLQGKDIFLSQSLRRKWFIQGITIALLFNLSALSYFIYDYRIEDNYRRDLRMWQIPEDLRHYGSQLKKLTFETGRAGEYIDGLDWLGTFNKLESISINLINNSKIKNLNFLIEMQKLNTVALKLTNSEVSDFSSITKLTELNYLYLDLDEKSKINIFNTLKSTKIKSLSLKLYGKDISFLKILNNFENLTSLKLAIKPMDHFFINDPSEQFVPSDPNINELKNYQNLTALEIDLKHSTIFNIDTIGFLEKIQFLNLKTSIYSITDLTVLTQLKKLTNLSLELSAYNNEINFLKKMKQLESLNLKFDYNNIDLSALAELNNLHSLTLIYPLSKNIPSLKALTNLRNLKTLELSINNENSDYDILKQLTELLTLNLSYPLSKSYDFNSLKEVKNITNLYLNLDNLSSIDFSSLKELKSLKYLDLALTNSDGFNINSIKYLNNLETLSISLNSSKLNNIDEIIELNKLTRLNFYLSGSENIRLLKNIKSPAILNIKMRYIQKSELIILKELKNLATLELDLTNSEIDSIDILSEIQAKEIKLKIGREQFKSLKGLPPSVTELTIGSFEQDL